MCDFSVEVLFISVLVNHPVCIYDKSFLAIGRHFFSYELCFYSSSYALLSLFYKNYVFNKKVFYLYNYCNSDFFSSFKIFRRRGKLRFKWADVRYVYFRSNNMYNSHLLERSSYFKKIKSSYRVRLFKMCRIPRHHYGYLAGVPVYNFKARELTKKSSICPNLSRKVYFRRKKNKLDFAINSIRAQWGRRRRRHKPLFFRKSRSFYRFRRCSVLKFSSNLGFRKKVPQPLLSKPGAFSYSLKTLFNAKRRFKAHLRLKSKRPMLQIYLTARLLPNLSPSAATSSLPTSLKYSENTRSISRFRKYRSWRIQPTQVSSFILHYVGLLILPKLNFKLRFANRPLSITRRKLYSFIKPNELRFRAFSARRRLISVKLIRRLSKSNISKKRLFSKEYLFNFFKTKQAEDLSSANPLVRVSPLTKVNMYYRENFFNFYKTNFTYSRMFHRDVSVERVRFKPGYQRLWRRFRLALAESLTYNYTYQQQLTKYLVKFSRKISQRSYMVKENTLRNIMLYSRLIPDLATFELLLHNSTVFLNHRLIRDYLIFIYKNDFIQCEVTIWFYIFSKWVMLWVRSRNAKFKRLVYKKSLAGRYKIMKQRKQKSRYTPKWIFLVDFDFIDVKPFLEVDYFTLSFFVVYDFKFFHFYRPEVFTENKLNIYRLYNWKYIN